MGSNKNEKRKPKSAVYRSFWASVVYFHLRLISTKSHKGEMTRNRVGGNTPRGFESHLLRQNKDHPSGWSLFFTSKVGFERRLLETCQWHVSTAVAFAAANGIPPPRSQRLLHTEGWAALSRVPVALCNRRGCPQADNL